MQRASTVAAGVRVPSHLREKWGRIAKSMGCNRSQVIRHFLENADDKGQLIVNSQQSKRSTVK